MPYKRTMPLCLFCKHLRYKEWDEAPVIREFSCNAFPEEVPGEIKEGYYDHREAYPGDNDNRFEKLDDFAGVKERSFFSNFLTMQQVEEALMETTRSLDYKRAMGITRPPLNPEDAS